jgi:hypothetical protein
MNREKVEWALQEEKKLKDANIIRPQITTKLRDGVSGFVGSLVGMQLPQTESYELMDLVSGVISGQLIPLSVHLENGQLVEAMITNAKPEKIEFAKPLYVLKKEQDAVRLIPHYTRYNDRPSVEGPMIDQLFKFLSKTLDVQMEHKSRTFSGNFLKGKDSVDKLERFLAEANEDRINFIAKNIDCYSAIKTEMKGRFSDIDNVLNMFDHMSEKAYRIGGNLTAKDLIKNYEWNEKGEMINPVKGRILIEQLIKQYEKEISPLELDKYKNYSTIITIMNDRSSSVRNVFFANKHLMNVNDIQEINEIFNLDKYPRNQQHTEWLRISNDAIWMSSVINRTPNISPIEIMQIVVGNLKGREQQNVPLAHLPRGNITNYFELTTLIDLINDDAIRNETARIAYKSCEIVKEMTDSSYDIRGVFGKFDELPAVDLFIQKQIFDDVKHMAIKEKYDFYKKGKIFEKLLDDGVLPAVAAKKAGIDRKDSTYLNYQYPILHKVKFDSRTRDLEH